MSFQSPWASRPAEPGRARQPRPFTLIVALVLTCFCGVGTLAAQEIQTLLSGYGAIGYGIDTEGENPNDFSAGASLVPLVGIDDDLLFEGEIEFSLHDQSTLVSLEHASVHYLGFESLRLTAGKFHLPFGVWHHTNWVNRMPSPPLLYEDAHGEPPSEGLLPILFDLGGMAEWTLPFGMMTSITGWVSQGPRAGVAHGHSDEEAHGGEEPPPEGEEEEESLVPALAYGSNYEDNNGTKMFGARLRTMLPGGIMLAGSGYRAAYDEAADLNVTGYNLSVMWSPGDDFRPMFDFRGEMIWLDQEFLHHDELEAVDHGGYYLQLSRRFDAVEPVVRWSALPEVEAGHDIFQESHRQLAVGVNYWLKPSSPLKIAYQWEPDYPDRLVAEWALGF